MMEKNAKIYVAGHRGMVGSAIVRELKRQGYKVRLRLFLCQAFRTMLLHMLLPE